MVRVNTKYSSKDRIYIELESNKTQIMVVVCKATTLTTTLTDEEEKEVYIKMMESLLTLVCDDPFTQSNPVLCDSFGSKRRLEGEEGNADNKYYKMVKYLYTQKNVSLRFRGAQGRCLTQLI